jgi:hypothetical protein
MIYLQSVMKGERATEVEVPRRAAVCLKAGAAIC